MPRRKKEKVKHPDMKTLYVRGIDEDIRRRLARLAIEPEFRHVNKVVAHLIDRGIEALEKEFGLEPMRREVTKFPDDNESDTC